jgi:hypothetical protein
MNFQAQISVKQILDTSQRKLKKTQPVFRILLFSSVTFKQNATKKYIFYADSFLKVQLHHPSKIKSHKEDTKQ